MEGCMTIDEMHQLVQSIYYKINIQNLIIAKSQEVDELYLKQMRGTYPTTIGEVPMAPDQLQLLDSAIIQKLSEIENFKNQLGE